jgi:hypothetical protein
MFFFFDRSDLQIASQGGLFRKLIHEPDVDIQELVNRHRALQQEESAATMSDDAEIATSGA